VGPPTDFNGRSSTLIPDPNVTFGKGPSNYQEEAPMSKEGDRRCR
jgi:hypothetical protein